MLTETTTRWWLLGWQSVLPEDQKDWEQWPGSGCHLKLNCTMNSLLATRNFTAERVRGQGKTVPVDSLRKQVLFFCPCIWDKNVFCVFILLFLWFQCDDLDLLCGHTHCRKYLLLLSACECPSSPSLTKFSPSLQSYSEPRTSLSCMEKLQTLNTSRNIRNELNNQHAKTLLNRIPTRIQRVDLLMS